MKLAAPSTAFDNLLRSGELTQLEWIDLCAHELAADGVVFDVRHFPRTDSDYLAQVKKMATDLGVTPAAVRDDAFFDGDEAAMEASLERALTLGAPLLAAPLPLETGTSWTEVQARLGTATSLAKRLNVTLALRNAPGTFAASSHDMKRASKEADSAWLRFGPDFTAIDAASDPQSLASRSVLAWASAQSDAAAIRDVRETLGTFCGFLVLDVPSGDATVEHMKNALRAWRVAFFEADRI